MVKSGGMHLSGPIPSSAHMSLLNSLARQVMQPATIEVVRRIAAHTYQLSLGGPALAKWTYVPGQTPNVFFGLSTRAEAAAGRQKLAVCTLSNGPGVRWAAESHPGDIMHFYGPGGKLLLDPTAPAYILLGDISCLAHFYELRRHLPAQVPVASVIHARHADDYFAHIDGRWTLHFMVANILSAERFLTVAQEQGLVLNLPQVLVYWGQWCRRRS